MKSLTVLLLIGFVCAAFGQSPTVVPSPTVTAVPAATITPTVVPTTSPSPTAVPSPTMTASPTPAPTPAASPAASPAAAPAAGAAAACPCSIPPNAFMVSGKGKFLIPADAAKMHVIMGADVRDTTAVAALDQLKQIFNDTTNALNEFGVENITEEGMSLYPIAEWGEDSPQLTGFQARNSLEFDIAPDQLGDAIDAALEGGINRIDSVALKPDEETQKRANEEALRLAVEDALAQGDILADALGRCRGEILGVHLRPTAGEGFQLGAAPTIPRKNEVWAYVNLQLTHEAC